MATMNTLWDNSQADLSDLSHCCGLFKLGLCCGRCPFAACLPLFSAFKPRFIWMTFGLAFEVGVTAIPTFFLPRFCPSTSFQTLSVEYCDGVRAKPRSRQICLVRKDNNPAHASSNERGMRSRSMQVDGRRLGGDPIGELS